MRETDVKIHYLFHSGFAVETNNHLLVFDYYKDTAKKGSKVLSNGAVGEEAIMGHKNILVFASHSHYDHYNPVIFDWSRINPDIKYVLSDDIETNEENCNIKRVSPYSELNIGDVHIKTYGSTDMGVSFLISLDGVTIFHAGDLNWWYWLDDTAEEIEKAEAWFKEEMAKINSEPIDIAFFPVDPRLNEKFSVGGEYFIKKLSPKYFIPMHFGQKYEITKEFKEAVKDCPSEVIEITHRGQEIVLTL